MSLPSLPPTAYTAEPLSTDEVDAHMDSDRIWATVYSYVAQDRKEEREAAVEPSEGNTSRVYKSDLQTVYACVTQFAGCKSLANWKHLVSSVEGLEEDA